MLLLQISNTQFPSQTTDITCPWPCPYRILLVALIMTTVNVMASCPQLPAIGQGGQRRFWQIYNCTLHFDRTPTLTSWVQVTMRVLNQVGSRGPVIDQFDSKYTIRKTLSNKEVATEQVNIRFQRLPQGSIALFIVVT
jgi:hypothetical protein